jgi:hypothetical protein
MLSGPMMMKSGLLWYDPDAKKAGQAKIAEAAQRYVEKFGVEPNACHVSPGSEAGHDSIAVVPDRWIRPGYFWLGVDEELPTPGPRRSRRDSEAIAAADRSSGTRGDRAPRVAASLTRRPARAGA